MTPYTRIEKYINEEPELTPKQKKSLILFTHKNLNRYSSILEWVRGLNWFRMESFVQRPSAERGEIIRTFVTSMGDPTSSRLFSCLPEILFGSFYLFLGLVLERSRKERCRQAKALMVELLVRSCEGPVEGSLMEDYIPGLHHTDELIRCRTCHFLYKHYGERALVPMISEIFKIECPVSLLLCKTISHFLQLHPEMSWMEQVKKIKGAEGIMAQNRDGNDSRELLLQEMQHSLSRHQFLVLDKVGDNRQRERIQLHQESSGNAAQKSSIGLRLERFEKITSSSKET